MNTENTANIIASLALGISALTALIQIVIYSQEWRAILSFQNIKISLKIDETKKQYYVDFCLNFLNVGKCVLEYKMKKLSIYKDGLRLPDVDEISKGSVVGVSQQVSFIRYYIQNMNNQENNESTFTFPKFKIDFDMEYRKLRWLSCKRKMEYEIVAEFDGINDYRVLYKKTIAT